MRSRITVVTFLVVFSVLAGLAPTSYAQINNQPLAAVSPTLNPFGLPLWYQGQDGVKLQLCLEMPTFNAFTGLVTQDPCLLEGLVDPTRPLNLPTTFILNDPALNFPEESFYYTANAIIFNAGPFSSLRMGMLQVLEVAFLGPLVQGQGIIFSRIQVDPGTDAGANLTNKLVPNSTYTWTFPMGEIVGTTDAVGNLGVQRHELGCGGPPCDFSLVLNADPFGLQNILGPNFLPAVGAPFAIPGYTGLFLGDPLLDAPITPGARGNFFRVTGPDAGGPGVDTMQTLAFSIMGKLFGGLPVTSVIAGDFNGDGLDDLAAIQQATGTVWFSTDLITFTPIPLAGAQFQQLVVGDFSAGLTGRPGNELAGLTTDGRIFVTTNMTSWTQVPGILTQLVSGDFNGDGSGDLAGLNSLGQIFFTTDLSTWTNVPGLLTQLASGNFIPARAGAELAGLNSAGQIFVANDVSAIATWTNVPGLLGFLLKGDFDGDGIDDLAGLNSLGQIFFTTDLATWTNVPGLLTQLTAGNFDGARPGDELAGLNAGGLIFFTPNMTTWTHVPGLLNKLTSANFGAPPTDLVGVNSTDGTIWDSANLATWAQIVMQ